MSDLFRCRSSTWSAGTPVADGDLDSAPSYEYADSCLPIQNAVSSTSNNSGAPMDQGCSGRDGGVMYSPANNSHTTTELGSRDFKKSRRLGSEKTPDSSNSDCNNNYSQTFYSASTPPRNSRDWVSGGFQISNFSVDSSSPYARQQDGGSGSGGGSGGGGGGLLAPYESQSPYANGSCPQQQPGLHSGSPSSAGSHLSSVPQQGMRSSVCAGGGVNSTSAQQSQTVAPNSGKRPARRNPWGSETYSDLIAKAIESHQDKQATLQQIYDFISTNYSFFRERSDPPASAGWKNSIRHNLSLHDKFIKCPKASESSKSSYWRLNANCLNRPYVRRRTCSLDTPGVSIAGKKAKTRLGGAGGVAGGGGGGGSGSGSGGGSMGAAAKRAVAMAAAAAAVAVGNSNKHSPGGYADDMLADLPNRGASRSHGNSISSGSSSAFSATGMGIKQESGSIVHSWNSPRSSFPGSDRKLSQEELNFFHKMHAETDSPVSLNLMNGAYEFQMPRAPNAASSGRSSISSGVGTSSSLSFCPAPIGRYPSFSVDPTSASRYPFCDGLPPPQSGISQLSGILTRSAECLDGSGSIDGPPPQQGGGHHHFLRASEEMSPMPHHGQNTTGVVAPHIANSHLHTLLTSGDTGLGMTLGGAGCPLGGGSATHNESGHQDTLELQLSLALADRVRNDPAVSNAVTQWAAATSAVNRTVENGV